MRVTDVEAISKGYDFWIGKQRRVVRRFFQMCKCLNWIGKRSKYTHKNVPFRIY